MTTQAPAHLVDVRCPVSGHVVFQAAAAQFGTVIVTWCRQCHRWVYGSDARSMRVSDTVPSL